MYIAMLMTEMQYYSPGRHIYYWFGKAFGIIRAKNREQTLAVYLGTESQVVEALNNGKRSMRPVVNKILDQERALQ